MTAPATSSYDRGLAIDLLRNEAPLTEGAIHEFLAAHEIPIIEGECATFLYHGQADHVRLLHRIVELPDDLPLRRIDGTDLWYLVLELPAGSRVEYRLEVTRDGTRHDLDDPLNPRHAHNPFGSNSVCYGAGYEIPTWTQPDPDARPGRLEELTIPSRAVGRACHVTLYLPARLRATARYPMLVVHDGATTCGMQSRRWCSTTCSTRARSPSSWSPSSTPGTGCSSTPIMPATPASSPRS